MKKKKISVTKHLMNLVNETTPHHVSDTYHLTVVRFFCAARNMKEVFISPSS